MLFHGGDWTERDYRSVPPGVQVDLHDGGLTLVPGAEPAHMLASAELAIRFRGIVGDRRRVLQEVDVYLADGKRYRTPDLLILREWRRERPCLRQPW